MVSIGTPAEMVKRRTLTQLSLLLTLSIVNLGQGTAVSPEQIRDNVNELIKAQWRRVEPASPTGPDRQPLDPSSRDYKFWEYRISPPFPAAWPPDGKGLVYYYAYAAARNPSVLMDGEWLGPLWARVSLDATSRSVPQLEILTREIKEVGTIGVRPLMKEEINIYNSADAVAAELRKAVQSADLRGLNAPLIRQYYCAWGRDTGMGKAIQTYHPAFFKWLSCKGL